MRTKSSLSAIRRRVASLSCLSLTAGTIAGVLLVAVPAAADPVSPTPPDYVSAALQAQATGQSVEVTDQTTETTQVLANPDGTFTMTADRSPVRVKQDGQWTPIDTTLQAGPDGTLAPAATTADVRFSGGGSGPLVSLAEGSKQVAFSWPTSLPTPVVASDTATYPAVLPGVDLKLQATDTGYAEVLVVHDATAAANPALQHLHLIATATGLNLAPANSGGLTATDAAGTVVFSGAAPTMWDSTIDPQVGATPAPFDAGSGRISRLGLTAASADGVSGTASTTVTLTPPAAALTGPDVHYPVYLDPQMDGKYQHYAVLFDNGTHFFDDPNIGDLKVGYCNFAECSNFNQLNARSYFQLSIFPLAGTGTAHIFAATVNANELHGSAGCTPEPVDLYSTSGDITSATTFPGPRLTKLQEISTALGDNCGGAGNVPFNNANVVSYVQAQSDANNQHITFGLLPPDPNTSAEWKRFSYNPSITVTYNYIPAVPTANGITGEVDCAGKHFVADTTPQVTGSGHDYNPSPLNTYLRFNIYPAGGTNAYASSADVQKTSDSIGAWTPPNPLTSGAWEYSVNDHNIPNSPYDEWSPSQSARYPFTVETPPTTTPTISSLDYPTGNWGAPQGTGGKFTVSDGGTTTTAGFSYGWDSASNIQSLQATNCNYNQINGTTGGLVAGTNSATITAPNLAPGPHTLYLKIFDDAHNLGTHLASYAFYVSPNLGPAATKFEAETLAATTGKFSQSDPTDPVYAENGSGFSGGQQQHLEPAAPGHSFSFTVTTGLEADDALGLQVSTANHFGQYRISVDGTPVLDPNKAADPNNPSANYLQLDAYSTSPGVRFVTLGGMHLAAGAHQITLTSTGKNPASIGVIDHGVNDAGLALGVDFLTIIPINNATAASFSAAMNNRGIATDGSAAADLKTASPAVGLSSVALATAGYAPGASVTIVGASFTLPVRNPAGNDNVIAAGQTIPFLTGTPNQQVHATDVALLANSTCFGSGSSQRTGTITYTDGTTSVAVFPAIPDWATGSNAAAAVNLDHQDIGSSASTAVQPKLYAILVPADPSKILQSITLPNYGTSFLTGSCPPAVHLYAIAPRPVATGWLGAWAAPADLASAPPGGAGFANQTIRLTVHPTVTGPTTRARLANTDANTPVTIDAASIAAQATTGPATSGTPTALTFCAATGQAAGCGVHSVTIPAGAEALSDPVPTPDTTIGSGNLLISLHLPTAVTLAPTHLAGDTTNYYATGNLTTNTDGTPFTSTTTNSYYLTSLDASTTDPTQSTVVVLGDETTARGASTGAADYQPTWVDDLPAHLASSGNPPPGGLVNASMNGQISSWWRDADTGAALNNTVLNEPNIRTVIVSLGAQDLLNNVPVSTIEDNIKALIQNTNTTDYGLRNHYRTVEGGHLHVVLTNIPALQLPANDPRETNRQQLNNDLANYTNFGATDFIDLDSITHNPSNPNQLDPSLTTTPGGTPTTAYYNQIADLIANAVPPVL